MAIVKGTGRAGMKWRASGVGTGRGVTWRIQGIEQVSRNINRELMKIKGRSAAGLISAANYVLTDADSGTPPLVPHDTGQLRESRFVDPKRKPTNGDPYVQLGYATNYAAAVHEMLQSPSGREINWNRPGSGPRFLQASLDRNKDKIIEIVRVETYIR